MKFEILPNPGVNQTPRMAVEISRPLAAPVTPTVSRKTNDQIIGVKRWVSFRECSAKKIY
jgi:hypothetical protein